MKSFHIIFFKVSKSTFQKFRTCRGYFYRNRIELNEKTAICYYKKAANNGNLILDYVIFADERGVVKNDKVAFEHFKQ